MAQAARARAHADKPPRPAAAARHNSFGEFYCLNVLRQQHARHHNQQQRSGSLLRHRRGHRSCVGVRSSFAWCRLVSAQKGRERALWSCATARRRTASPPECGGQAGAARRRRLSPASLDNSQGRLRLHIQNADFGVADGGRRASGASPVRSSGKRLGAHSAEQVPPDGLPRSSFLIPAADLVLRQWWWRRADGGVRSNWHKSVPLTTAGTSGRWRFEGCCEQHPAYYAGVSWIPEVPTPPPPLPPPPTSSTAGSRSHNNQQASVVFIDVVRRRRPTAS